MLRSGAEGRASNNQAFSLHFCVCLKSRSRVHTIGAIKIVTDQKLGPPADYRGNNLEPSTVYRRNNIEPPADYRGNNQAFS